MEDTDDRRQAPRAGSTGPRPGRVVVAPYGRAQAPERCCRCPDRVEARRVRESGTGN
ncbi:hypothetical protein AX27061_1028 [Achromobacter xylosoxidans NBRC 15126 = ATCC 27061]|nr:hypothetical protein AX27061_1028 [Achromobacter xylosoxidans NBRC 15126 = ATCC 27061]